MPNLALPLSKNLQCEVLSKSFQWFSNCSMRAGKRINRSCTYRNTDVGDRIGYFFQISLRMQLTVSVSADGERTIVSLLLSTTPRWRMKLYLHAFFISGLDGGQRSGDWLGTRASLNLIYCHCWDRNTCLPALRNSLILQRPYTGLCFWKLWV